MCKALECLACTWRLAVSKHSMSAVTVSLHIVGHALPGWPGLRRSELSVHSALLQAPSMRVRQLECGGFGVLNRPG